jgi:hypothetical protein
MLHGGFNMQVEGRQTAAISCPSRRACIQANKFLSICISIIFYVPAGAKPGIRPQSPDLPGSQSMPHVSPNGYIYNA